MPMNIVAIWPEYLKKTCRWVWNEAIHAESLKTVPNE